MLDIMQMIGACFVLVIGMMVILWLIYVFQRNAGIVDIGWALGFAICALIYFFLADGYWARRWLITFMVLVWSLRLAWYLSLRFFTRHEDHRYTVMKEGWGDSNQDIKVLAMFLFQGLLVILLSFIFLVIARNPSPKLTGWEIAGLFLWLIGTGFETLADWQLLRFKQDPQNQGQVCRVGLWRFSRHPNYFFEFIIWLGYFVFALGSPWGWAMIYCPALMLFLLLKLSGIPLAEAQAVETRGEAYRDYQRKTSKFIPWFPKQ